MPPTLSPARLALALAGLLLVVVSLVVAFNDPYGLWHWLLLAAAGGALWAMRRV